MATRSQGPFGAARNLLAQTPLGGAGKFLQNLLLPEELERVWAEAARAGSGRSVFGRFLTGLGVEFEFSDEELRRIPAQGPVVVVANHPFGLVEGAILGALLARVRPDFKFLANSLLASVPELGDRLFAVDPFGSAARSNWKALRQSVEWLKRGGMLATFPAGEVASLQLPRMKIADPAWNENISRLIQMTHASSVPIFFHGTNGPAFQIAGLIHPRLRTALLPLELLNKRGHTIRVSIGRPIGPQCLTQHTTNGAATQHLWHRTHVLQARDEANPVSSNIPWLFGPRRSLIAGAVDANLMRSEVDRLPADQRLIESGEYVVCVASAAQIPNILREIGRLREITFREAGEGTGRSLDLDRFDAHYQHLWMWNARTNEVAGAYRLAGTDSVLSRFGPRGLYTSTLFRFRPGLLESFHPALELGRSFVRTEYQKSYIALLLLWKGIGHYVAKHPRYRVLFGPVSISREYNPASRSLMVSYLKARCANEELAALVEPKQRFRSRRLRGCDTGLLGPYLANVDELSEVVSDLEPDGKGIPVLLRHYLSVGGRILAFNVDAQFSGVVDGLVVVDLLKLSRKLIERYLGPAGAESFARYHSASTNEARKDDPSNNCAG